MSVVDFFFSGANLPFVIALGVGVLYVLVGWSGVLALFGDASASGDDAASGEGGAGDADAGDAGDADAGDANASDADADASDADADADSGDADGDDADGDDADGDDADGDDADGDDANGHAERQGVVRAPVRAVAGPRHVMTRGSALPLSVRGPISLVVAGTAGLAANAIFFAESAALPLYSLAWTAPLALGCAAIGGRVVSRALAPILDERANQATSRRDLVGCFGTVISSAVRPDFGEVRFRDRSGHQVRIVVKLAPDAPALTEGDEAVVVDLDATGTPLVQRLDVAPP